MTPEEWQRIQERFHEVLEAPAPERPALLSRLETDDPALAAEVRSLLEAESQGPLVPDPGRPREEVVAGYVGPYHLLRRLGEGGMGTVYLAERVEAGFTQRVALKLLRAGFLDSRLADHVAHERRILARLEHPNIARLIDGGSTPSGQPYLAMEYVEGKTLLEHATARALALGDRVRLMAEVCEAVHYAHQQLVVHRDLKPSNIMVGTDGRPRLLDFGISKLLTPEERTSGATRSTPWITPAYASPEQFRGGTITTLSDVYALGVVLYELLSGARPYQLDGRSPAEMERLICDEDPRRPSERAADPKLARALQGDLDTITLKALAKQPGHRYASAEQLAEDLRRYLDGQPVLARPANLRYRAGKFIQRHRTAVGAAAVALVLLVGGTLMVARQAGIARRERDNAEAARREAEQVTAYVTSLFEGAEAGRSTLDTTATRALLLRGVEQAKALSDQPVTQASMFDALGMVFASLQRYDQASELVQRAWQLRLDHLPPSHPDVAESDAHLGRIRRAESRYPEAKEHYERALEIRKRAFGPEHPKVAESYRDLGFLMPYLGRNQESVRYYREALTIDRAVYGEEHPQTADDLRLVGLALRRVGEAATGLALLQEALAIRERLGLEDPTTAVFRFHVADQMRQLGRGREAEAIYRQGIAEIRRTGSPTDPALGHGLENLATLLAEEGRDQEAESLSRELVEIQRSRYGENSIVFASGLDGLSWVLAHQKRYREALALRKQSLDIWLANFGTDHASVAWAYDYIAGLCQDLGRLEEAEQAARKALEVRLRIYGPEQVLTGYSRLRLANILLARNRATAAESEARAALAIVTAQPIPDSSSIREVHRTMARVYAALGRGDQAAEHRRLAGGS